MSTKNIVHFILLQVLLMASLSCEQQNESTPAGSAGEQGAIARLTAAIAENPQDTSLYLSRAQAYYEQNGFDQAIEDLTTVLQRDSANITALHTLADVYMDYYKSRLALETMQRAAELHPDRILTLLKLSEFQLILQQYDESMATLDEIMKKDPQNAEAYFMFGMNFKDMGDTARAINSFQTAVEQDPDLIDGWMILGQLHADLGNDIAERYFDSAIEIAPQNVEVLHAKAFYLQEQNDLQGSLDLFRRIIQIDPQYEDAYYNAGLLYLDMDSIKRAQNQFNTALEVAPLHIRAYYHRGVANELLGKYEEAKADYEQALRLAPDYEGPKEGLQRLQELQ